MGHPIRSSGDEDKASSILHHANNMICSIRLLATGLMNEPQHQETAQEILAATRELEAAITSLADLVGKSNVLSGPAASRATHDCKEPRAIPKVARSAIAGRHPPG